MENCKQPAALNINGDINNNWKKFKQSFEIYMMVSDPEGKKASNLKAAILLNAIGEDGIEVYNTFQLLDAERLDYNKIINSFDEYCKPRLNVIVERYLFNMRSQHDGETIDHYVTELKKMADTCNFENQTKNMIRDRIVIGTRDKALQERLLRIPDLTMEKAIEMARTSEASKTQIETLCTGKSVQRVKTKENVERTAKNQGKTQNYEGVKRKTQGINEYFCKKCNTKHKWRNCPAYGKQCHGCGKFNHYKVCCRFKSKECKLVENEFESNSSSDENLNISAIKIKRTKINKINNSDSWKSKLQIEGKEHIVKLDTGAESNIITCESLVSLGIKKELKKTTIMLVPWRGEKVKPEGAILLECMNNNNKEKIKFIVVKASNTEKETIIGGDSCIKLGYIKRLYKIQNNNLTKEEFVIKNREQFEGEAQINTKWSLKIRKDINPKINPPRRVPNSVEKALKETLSQLVRRKIIKKVDQPEGWVSNIVIKQKPNGTLRICLDPKELNSALIKESVLIPTVEELTSKIADNKIFSVFDLREGFWQVGLDHKSSKLCTFTTPFGTYRFKRLPFGLSVAPEIFQKLNSKNFENIPNVVIYFDDLLIMAKDESEHDATVEKVLSKARELGIKFNKDKLQYKLKEVKYLGYLISETGMGIDNDRIESIKNLKEPRTKKQLQRFLGIVGYLRRFIPRMSQLTTSLRELLKKNRKWAWYPEHSNAINKLKQEIIKATTLTHYNRSEDLVIQTDASKNGLGSCLMQNGRPLAFASRSLSETECGYAQIEKEMLAIVFATQKFHYYIYGKKTKVQSDHKPLISIFKKKIADINSNRLQRLRLKTIKYDLDVEHIPGKDMLAADLLSRDYIEVKTNAKDEKKEKVIHSVTVTKQVTKGKMEEIRQETEKDETLKRIMKHLKGDWKLKKEDKKSEIKKYWNIRKELSVEGGIVLHRGRIVIPKTLKQDILNKIHGGHIGIHKAKKKAREIVYWPTMSKDIDNDIKQCKLCISHSNQNIKEPIITEEKPELPFYKVGADLLDYGGKSYLAVVDYCSNWLELKKTKDKTAGTVIKILMEIFSTHGIPQVIRADNMPFASYEFKTFAKDWDIEVVNSSPHYPKSNGLAERTVGICKQMLKKSEGNQEALWLALMEYRNTPLANRRLSPAQLAMGRRIRSRLPIRDELLKPNQTISDREEYEKLKERMRKNYNRSAKLRPEFEVNEDIVTRKDGKWITAKIVEKHTTPRSYIIEDETGSVVRRNKQHIKSTKLKFDKKHQDNLDDYEIRENLCGKQDNNKQRQSELGELADSGGKENRTRGGRIIKKPEWMKDFVTE